MKLLIIAVLVLIILGLYYMPEQTKELFSVITNGVVR